MKKMHEVSILLITLEMVTQSLLFTCNYIQQSQYLTCFAGNTNFTQNKNVSFLSEFGQSILHFHYQVKINSYVFAYATLDF